MSDSRVMLSDRCFSKMFAQYLKKKTKTLEASIYPPQLLLQRPFLWAMLHSAFQVHLLYTEGALKPPPLARGPPSAFWDGTALPSRHSCAVSAVSPPLGISFRAGEYRASWKDAIPLRDCVCLYVATRDRSICWMHSLSFCYYFSQVFTVGMCGVFFFLISPTLALFFMSGSVFLKVANIISEFIFPNEFLVSHFYLFIFFLPPAVSLISLRETRSKGKLNTCFQAGSMLMWPRLHL